MTKLTRFFATGLLVVALSAVAFADGGETQGPPQASPAPSPAESSTGVLSAEPLATPQDSSVDIVTEATTILSIWLQSAIL